MSERSECLAASEGSLADKVLRSTTNQLVSNKHFSGQSTYPEVLDSPVGEQVATLVLLVRYILDWGVGAVIIDGSLAALLEERGHIVVLGVIEGPAFQNLRRHNIPIGPWRRLLSRKGNHRKLHSSSRG